MKRKQIYNLHSSKKQLPRLFDIIVEDNKVILEIKRNHSVEVVPWEDVLYQVSAAIEEN